MTNIEDFTNGTTATNRWNKDGNRASWWVKIMDSLRDEKQEGSEEEEGAAVVISTSTRPAATRTKTTSSKAMRRHSWTATMVLSTSLSLDSSPPEGISQYPPDMTAAPTTTSKNPAKVYREWDKRRLMECLKGELVPISVSKGRRISFTGGMAVSGDGVTNGGEQQRRRNSLTSCEGASRRNSFTGGGQAPSVRRRSSFTGAVVTPIPPLSAEAAAAALDQKPSTEKKRQRLKRRGTLTHGDPWACLSNQVRVAMDNEGARRVSMQV